MEKLEKKQEIRAITLLFALTYMVSYITRTNYGAIISEMVHATGYSKSLLSMALTGSFITYGAGQIVSGICGDKFSPKRLISCGLCITVLTNLLIPLCRNPFQMLVVWCVNGFAQSFLWPPLVRLMTTLLSEQDYKMASTKVSWGGSMGTIVVYLLSPALIATMGWRSVFWVSAAFGIVMIVIWNKYAYEIEPTVKKQSASAEKATGARLFTPLLFGIMLAIVLQGMLRDGVTTWMPSYISETYGLSNVISILTGVILPAFSIVCFQLATWLYMRKFQNPLVCAGVFFGAGILSAMGLYLLSGQNAGFSIALSALLTGSMHGVNLILICMIPPFFKKNGNVSTVSGMLNACTYVGSATSSYGIAVLSEKLGWNFTLLSWLVIAAAGTAVCLLCARPWNKTFQEDSQFIKK